MRFIPETDEFKVAIMSRKAISGESRLYYESAYAAWKKFWNQTLSEVGETKTLYSDDFLHSDEVVAVFHRGNAIALCLLDRVDLTLASDRDASALRWFQSDVLSELEFRHCQKAVLARYFTVDPEWRQTMKNWPVKEVLGELVMRRYLASDADVLLAITRRNRGMSEFAKRLGGQ